MVWIELVSSTGIGLVMVAVIWLSFTDYTVMRLVLSESENEADAGQTLSLC